MVAPRKLVLFSLSTLALLGGCAAPPSSGSEVTGHAESDIINGTKDTTHTAVVALLGQNSECTGTVFSVDANAKKAYVLSAGHCVNEPGSPADPPQVVMVGNDYNNPTTQYTVVNYVAHPSWPGNQDYDYSIITIDIANKPTPATIPLITKAQDDLAAGTQVDFVGYGVTSVSGGGQFNSLRYHVKGQLDQVTSLNVHYNQSNSGQYANNAGPCSGDSGGPALYTIAGVGEVVAAVTSRGDAQCNQEGISSRVSAVLDWITGCISGGDCSAGMAQTCDQCAQTSTDAGGACAASWNACVNDNSCLALVNCLNACQTQACVDQCAQDNANGVAKYTATLDCICTSGCPAECASAGFCQGQQQDCGFSSSDASCNTCLTDKCCSEGAACANDAACTDCFTNANADPSCVNTNNAANAFAACLETGCSVECGIGGGGTGGTGGAGGATSAGGTTNTGGTTATGGSGASNAGGSGGGGAGGDGGKGSTQTTINCGACSTGTGSSSGDGLVAILSAAMLGVFGARRRRERH